LGQGETAAGAAFVASLVEFVEALTIGLGCAARLAATRLRAARQG
jgi:hypothetical protein